MQRGHQVGQRPDHPQRVAVGDDHPGVGIGGEDQVERRQVRRCLEHEAFGGRAPLPGLEHPAVPVVDRGLVDARAPDGVAAHVVEPGEHVAGELVGEGEDALGRQEAAVLVHGGEGRDHLVHDHHLLVRSGGPRVVVIGPLGVGGGGHAVEVLPQPRGPVVRVAGQQLVQQGGAGPAQAGDDDGGGHRLGQHGRLASHRSTRRRRFCSTSWSSARARMRPARCSWASSSRARHRRSRGWRNQSSPKSSDRWPRWRRPGDPPGGARPWNGRRHPDPDRRRPGRPPTPRGEAVSKPWRQPIARRRAPGWIPDVGVRSGARPGQPSAGQPTS